MWFVWVFFSISPHFLSQLRCKWCSWIFMKSQSFWYLLLPPLHSSSPLSLFITPSLFAQYQYRECGRESWRCLMGDNLKEFSQWGGTSILYCTRERTQGWKIITDFDNSSSGCSCMIIHEYSCRNVPRCVIVSGKPLHYKTSVAFIVS